MAGWVCLVMVEGSATHNKIRNHHDKIRNLSKDCNIGTLYEFSSVTILLKTLSKNRRGENTSRLILQDHHYLDTKVRQEHCEKRKLQANIPININAKILQQNISKPNSVTC